MKRIEFLSLLIINFPFKLSEFSKHVNVWKSETEFQSGANLFYKTKYKIEINKEHKYSGQFHSNETILVMLILLGPNIAPILHYFMKILPMKYQY